MSELLERPLRIALMTETARIGGLERMLLNLAVDLRRRGHEVELLGPGHGPDWLNREFMQLGFPVHTWTLRRAIDFGAMQQVTRLAREREYDLLHSHMFPAAFYGAVGAGRAKVPHVITMHGDGNQTSVLRRRVALRYAFRRAAATIAVSSAMRDDLQRSLGATARRMHVIANGVPEQPGDRQPVRDELRLDPDELLIVAIGSYCERKAHHLLMEALKGLPPEIRWRAALAGGDEGYEKEIRACHARLGLEGKVHLLGPRRDIGNLLAAADVFAMPSLWEGLPLALLEAMFAGKAIVTTNVGGIPEALADGVSALLVPPADVLALLRALHDLLRQPALRQTLGIAAQQRARSAYSVGAMTDEHLRLYRRVASPTSAVATTLSGQS